MARSRGLPKTGQQRYAKWVAKYDPTTIGNRFNQVAAVAQSRAQEGLIAMATIQNTVSQILDGYGIAGPMRAVYISFGYKVAHEAARVTGPALNAAVQGLVSYWSTAYGANPTILQAIANAVTGGSIVLYYG